MMTTVLVRLTNAVIASQWLAGCLSALAAAIDEADLDRVVEAAGVRVSPLHGLAIDGAFVPTRRPVKLRCLSHGKRFGARPYRRCPQRPVARYAFEKLAATHPRATGGALYGLPNRSRLSPFFVR